MKQTSTDTAALYDPRWFVWTIVFLLATGMALVTYIFVSDDSSQYQDLSVRSPRSAPSTPVAK